MHEGVRRWHDASRRQAARPRSRCSTIPRSAASSIRSSSARSSSSSSTRPSRNAADNLARAKIASGFGFWNDTAGFDISQTLIAYSAQASTYGRAFWVGLLNTLLVAVDRHRPRDHPRLHRRHRAAVAATGSSRARRRLCRDHPQHAAAAAAAVLVQRRAQGAAGPARQLHAVRAASSSTTAACSLPQPIFQHGIGFVGRRAASSASSARSRSASGRASGRSAPASSAPVVLVALGADRRPAAASCSSLAGMPVDVRVSREGPLQLPRRHRDPAGVRRAAGRPRRSTPPPSSPRSCAPASWRCRKGQTEAAQRARPAHRPDAASWWSSRRRCA